MDRVDCIVVGAGVVGLAVARALSVAGREVVVLEAEGLIGSHTSSRNSEVIHAGIYYPQDSAKARLCVRGKHLLYAYCAARGVPHRRLGKIIVATDPEQEGALAGIRAKAAANGVPDLEPLDAADLNRMEPALRGVAGLLSPSTGIIDSHSLMLSLSGRGRGSRRDDRLPHPLSRRDPPARRRLRPARGEPWRDRDLRLRPLGERSRPLRGPGRGRHRGPRRAASPGGALLQGQLFRRLGAGAVLAA